MSHAAIAMLPQLSRYSMASAMALGLDFATYLALVGSGVPAPLAGIVGYLTGTTLHFAISKRFVFDARRAAKGEPQLFGEFALSGVVGLLITAIVISCATGILGTDPVTAKVLAAGLSFLLVFGLRRGVVFAPRETAESL
jgi:putative flippase GtrA